ncbi:uncharacterized protein LOC126672505 [Mercurialis annua]|uniref:uncharacterized protein LOC126672505 n=1 Tax=Mercurialis annua TaxID=3986 RepID=UPI0024AE280D|nr:uncharacterized protein LOC126672505 [Mercurialis annua]
MGTPSDKSWMTSYRFSSCYIQGVKNFLNVAKDFTDSNGRVRCPCKNCINIYLKPLQEVKMDLYQYGISENYTNWVHHGETSQPRDSLDGSINSDNELEDSGNDVSEMLDDMCNATFMDTDMEDRLPNQDNNMLEGEVAKFAKLWNDSHCELYPGSQKYSKLSFLLKMINIKALTNSSNKSFFSNLELFKDALPRGETLPSSSYEVKKLMRDLGLGYVTIDACVNDCVLFWKENENLDTCPTCKAPRWKLGFGKRKKVAQKILRHFPLVPRLQMLFMSKDIGENMRWHKEKRVDDDTIRHPADATEWKDFDQKYAWFGKDARNVRLGLASDGFNPFGNMSTSYSMWPVIVTPYNLPPWKCMKENFLMLSLLIPGKESPGNNIDVYLRPLIDELKELWETGVSTYDAYSVKQCYMGHRRYLHAQHSWRKSRKFDGKPEHGSKPEELSGDEVLRQLDLLPKSLVFGKTPNQKKRARGPEELNWTKRNGYASNLSRCVSVQDCKVMGMKSHDYHIFLQRLLPASICGSLRSEVYTALSELSSFFKELCSKTLKRSTVKKLQSDIILIICKLEMIYPPSFFVVMMHLVIHLPREVELGGPVHYRWMYFIERFLRTLENYDSHRGITKGKCYRCAKKTPGRICQLVQGVSTDHIYALGLGPDIRIARYSGIIVNGVRFHTVERDNFRRTQNNGVSVTGEHKSKEIEFYGVLTDIIDLQYVNGNHVFLFKCDWWDVGDKNGIKTDGNLVSVNVSRKWYTGDSFVLSSQVQQVFYVSDMKNGGHWKIVQKSFHRNIFDVPEKEKVCN